MLTVLESLELSSKYLEGKGIESARLNAELLLAHILDCKRLDLYMQFNKPLSAHETEIYRDYIKRRGNFEPYQYIVGEVEFYGLRLFVDENVLIPRQETEILIETIIDEFKDESELKILDIGSGSGNIPISLAVNINDSKVISIDVSPDAIKVAEKNCEYHNLKSRIGFKCSDIFTEDFPKYQNRFDIVVSNPPYVEMNEAKNLQKEIVNFEPQIAITDFNDGLKFYREISNKSKNLLSDKGKLFFEVGEGQADSVKEIMEADGFSNIIIKKDLLGIERVVFGNR